MRFMIIRHADDQTEAGAMPTEELLTQMTDYIGEMADAGILHAGDGLHPSTKGVRISFADGEPTITDGPFSETKELIAGFHIIEVDSLEEAVEWTKRWPAEIDGNPTIEIRQIFEPEEFGEAYTDDARENVERMRAGIEANQ